MTLITTILFSLYLISIIWAFIVQIKTFYKSNKTFLTLKDIFLIVISSILPMFNLFTILEYHEHLIYSIVNKPLIKIKKEASNENKPFQPPRTKIL